MLSYIKWPIVKTSLKMGLKAENYPSFNIQMMDLGMCTAE